MLNQPLPKPTPFKQELGQNQPLPEDGLYLFDKPKGISSFQAVYILRRELKQKHGKKVKVGHCGTLDPIATGLLILVSGKLTKRAGELTKKDKVYTATAKLGASSTTYDSEGELSEELSLDSNQQPSRAELRQALQTFLGASQQVPPIFSALKVGGQRAYKLARTGQEVKLNPRPIEVYSIELLEYSYPKLKFRVHVSSGTYIRSLIHDLGLSLGTGAHMTELHRNSITPYHL